jgi:hypothetical protein
MADVKVQGRTDEFFRAPSNKLAMSDIDADSALLKDEEARATSTVESFGKGEHRHSETGTQKSVLHGPGHILTCPLRSQDGRSFWMSPPPRSIRTTENPEMS